ncbi:acetoacetyl-CoA synthase [Rheinheimera riviphila]|uniref:Acetoacetyl-CoA synthase n=1 Tax=Rheinheimera riviphila TaxID=1834037 RepID=A0A437QIV8_9GAMM|nr:type II toxin-antitoxin system CcdA family antitoxin [Rheinheimera riviphila]RVU34320.1 acetoacetyl-CoA synthase [Rheinheimera riviphila]
MNHVYDLNAAKKPTNLSINSDLLAKARGLNINLSATLEKALAEQVQNAKRAQWALDNADAIKAYNEFVEANGTFSDSVRKF